MPTYDYKCPECGIIKEIVHSIKEDPIIYCSECLKIDKKIIMERMITYPAGGFIFKQWTEAQAYKIKRDKYKNNEILEKKQKERYGEGPKLVPNVNGEIVESWEKAKMVAKDKKLNDSTYDKMIQKENNKKIVSL
jgi:putative FmdB family regulatory protein